MGVSPPVPGKGLVVRRSGTGRVRPDPTGRGERRVSTYVAHTVGEAVGLRVREDRSLDRAAVRHEIRDALPIATAAGAPAALLLLAWTDLLDADVVLVLALALVDLRLALLGSVVAWVSGERSSTRVFLAGFVLAVVGAAVALLKWQLTH